MPWGAIQLQPGVNTQKTLSDNAAGVSVSQLIRYKTGLIQSEGGWVGYVNFTIGSTVRDLHPWQDITGVQHLGVAGTANLGVITAGSYQEIMPQTVTTNPALAFSISSGSNIVTVGDSNANASTFNTIYLNTPISLGTILLNGPYHINNVLASSTYQITAAAVSCTTITSSGILPKFAISSGTANIVVTLPNNGFQSIVGLFQQFIAPTQVGTSSNGILVSGKYQIATVVDSTNFTINAVNQASTTATATMNSTLAQIVYYVTVGPPIPGSGFGVGPFGSNGSPAGGFGTGSPGVSTPGTPITTTEWTTDNWGEIYLTCPKDGAIYAWSPDFGFQNAQVISGAPFFNGGIFVSMPQQILVAYRSIESSGVQDPLIIRWSNAGDYTNWTVSNQTTAGSFHFSSGSYIVGAIQCPQFALVSTDIEVYTMTYVGGVVIFNFTKIGNGCGWIGPHACGVLSGLPYWMGTNNFFTIGAGGVVPMPCSVWDVVFQNLSTANQSKVRVAVNSTFNEVAWFYPSAASTGECDSYVKVHIEGGEFEWVYGVLNRTAWTDVSILGMPIGVDSNGQIYQHETGTTISGAGLPSFQTGYWTIGEGEDIPFIDLIIPDFDYGLRSASPSASLSITFFGANYPGDAPTTYGPFTVTSATEFINVRIRNRLLSAFIQSSAGSEFWRIGRIRFRYGAAGRR